MKKKNKLKSEGEWVNVMDIPEFMGKTYEERVRKYIAFLNAGIKIEKIR